MTTCAALGRRDARRALQLGQGCAVISATSPRKR